MKLSIAIDNMIITIGANEVCNYSDLEDVEASYEMTFSVVKDKELCFEKKMGSFKGKDLYSIMEICQGLISGSDQNSKAEFIDKGLTVRSRADLQQLEVIVRATGGEPPVISMALMMIPQEYVPDLYKLLKGVICGLAVYECDFELPQGSAVHEDKMKFDPAKGLYGADYYEFGFKYPCCNHTEGLSECNVGYSQGALDGNIPFEIELVKEVDKSYICVMIPRNYVFYSEDITPDIEQSPDIQKAVLPIGLKYEGCIDDDNYIESCCSMLYDYGVISFLEDSYIANTEWYLDGYGTELTMISLILEENGKKYAKTDMEFRSFKDFMPINPPIGKTEDFPVPGVLMSKNRKRNS